MAFPVFTADDLSKFTGQPVQMYGIWVDEAISQAAFLVEVVTGVHDLDPNDAYGQRLYMYSVLEIAGHLYAEQEYWMVNVQPFQSETIGSYSYTKSATSVRISNGDLDGLVWLPLYQDYLASIDAAGAASGISSGQIIGSEYDDVGITPGGNLRVLSPRRDVEFFDPYSTGYERGYWYSPDPGAD